MSTQKQHYVPQFYLKRWSVDGKLTEFSRPNPNSREVKPHRKPPKGTAYREGAYDFEGLPPEKRHHLEKVFFRFVDGKAADALALMETGSGAWTVELRQAWVMFLLSLIMRHPDDIAAFKSVYVRDFRQATGRDEEVYLAVRTESDPPTAEEYFATVGRAFLQNMALNNVPKLLQHDRSVTELMKMHWSVAAPHRDGYFLTSDRPTVRTFLGTERSHWLVPIGPQRLFVAARTPALANGIHKAVAGNGWKEVNRQVVRQAVALGFANDDRHLPFFQKHLAAATRPSVFWDFVAHPKTADRLIRVS